MRDEAVILAKEKGVTWFKTKTLPVAVMLKESRTVYRVGLSEHGTYVILLGRTPRASMRFERCIFDKQYELGQLIDVKI